MDRHTLTHSNSLISASCSSWHCLELELAFSFADKQLCLLCFSCIRLRVPAPIPIAHFVVVVSDCIMQFYYSKVIYVIVLFLLCGRPAS